MAKRVIGALLLLIVGVSAIVAVWYFLPRIQEARQKATSDARTTKGTIRIALDNWIGYFPLRSPEMVSRMRRDGWILTCEDDKADYAGRMKRLKSGQIEFAVATVDSYILNAAGLGFPGTIVTVIDESKGGDAILGNRDRVASLNALRGSSGLRVAYTPDSPSHHLAKAAAYHFSVPELLPPPGELRIETKGSEQALSKLLAGKADLAIMWEPDVTRALAHPGVVKILGTEDTTRLIVDVLVVNREFSAKNPGAVHQLLSTYFMVLKSYNDNPALLRRQVIEETGLPADAVDPMLKGVRWLNLTENCEKWFGIAGPGGYGDEGLIKTIEATVRILVNSGDFAADPIPGGDPRRLIYSAYIEDLCVKGIVGFTQAPGAPTPVGQASSLEARFPVLDSAGWDRLREVGNLKVDPIAFQHGATELDLLAKQVIDQAVELLKHYPRFRVLVKGHTGTVGDPVENRRLSLDRAEAVARYLQVAYNIDPNRMRTLGLGGDQPLPRMPEESPRTWQYRLPRVELVLAREEF